VKTEENQKAKGKGQKAKVKTEDTETGQPDIASDAAVGDPTRSGHPSPPRDLETRLRAYAVRVIKVVESCPER